MGAANAKCAKCGCCSGIDPNLFSGESTTENASRKMISFGQSPKETPKKKKPLEAPILKIHKTFSPERMRADEPVMVDEAEHLADVLFEEPAFEDPAATGVAKFNGYWMHRSIAEGEVGYADSHVDHRSTTEVDVPVAHIENGLLRWRILEAYDDEALQQEVILTQSHAGDLVLDTGLQDSAGSICTGKLINGTIKWSDGETWHRDPNGENIVKFNGTWLQDSEPVARIWELYLHWYTPDGYEVQDGVQTALILTDFGTLEMLMGDQKFTGELIDGALCWSDGMKWTKYYKG